MSAFKTGKVVAATSAIETEEGDIVPSEGSGPVRRHSRVVFYGVASVIYLWSIRSSCCNGFLPSTALSHSRRDS